MANINKLKANSQEPSALMAGGPVERVNPWKKEYWRAYNNRGILVYNKEKTLDNCWKKYGMIHRSSNVQGDPDHSWESNRKNNLTMNNKQLVDAARATGVEEWWNILNQWHNEEANYFPYIVDLENYINNEDYFLSLNGHMRAEYKVYEVLREWYKNNDIRVPTNNYLFGHYFSNGGPFPIFKEKDRDWTFNINIGQTESANLSGWLPNTNVKEVTLNFKNGSLRVMDNMFGYTSIQKLNILFNGTTDIPVQDIKEGFYVDSEVYYKGLQPNSIQRIFDNCNQVTNPNDLSLHLFSWRHCYQYLRAFNGCTITHIPPGCGCVDFEEHPANTMRINDGGYVTKKQNWWEKEFNGEWHFGTAREMFSFCEITKVATIIDMKCCPPGYGTEGMFWNSKIREIRLKNLANGDWNLTDLTLLDKPSVDYIFNNLRDMTQFQEGKQTETFLLMNTSTLRCPQEWEPHITQQMIDSAKRKGWRIFINNVEK